MPPLDDVLAAFKRDWMAGAQPDIDLFLSQVPADQRDEFIDLVDTWIAITPDVALAPGVLSARVAADPSLTALTAAYDAAPGSLAELVPQLRAARGWSVADLAAAFVARVGLPSSSGAKVGSYLERVETGDHAPASVSRKALNALGDLFGVGSDALLRAAASASPPPMAAPQGARFRAAAAPPQAAAELHDLAEALRTPAPVQWDAVDELFCSG